MTPVCERCKRNEATHGTLCASCRYAKPPTRDPSPDAETAFMAPGTLSGKSILHIPRFLAEEQLQALLDSPDTDRTLSGRPVREVVREELDHRQRGGTQDGG